MDCRCTHFLTRCQILGCHRQTDKVSALQTKGYTDGKSRRIYRAERVWVHLCTKHQNVRGFAWTTKPYPQRYRGQRITCQTDGCSERSLRVEVKMNATLGRGYKTKGTKGERLVLILRLCRGNHQYIHGFSYTKVAYPLVFYGAFYEDLEEFGFNHNGHKESERWAKVLSRR